MHYKYTHETMLVDAGKRVDILEAATQDWIQEWLKYSPDRDGGRQRRADKKKGKYITANVELRLRPSFQNLLITYYT